MIQFFKQAHVIAAAIWIFSVSLAGGVLTEIGPWYYSLKQPDWKPPDWAFGMIWTTIFVLSAMAWILAWRASTHVSQKKILAILFIVNGMLNALWSFLYFKLHRPDWSFIESGFLWLSVFLIIVVMLKFCKSGALLMLPYLIWVSTAILLNYEAIRLNGPFQ
jgi:tryptophan-rich sensory protein